MSSSTPASANEDDLSEDVIIEETEAESSVSGEQRNLLTHPRAKSKCWQFFGFRTDSDGTILDKKKVFCRLCSTSLPYCGNTTNLAYHIDIADTAKAKKKLTLQGSLYKVKPYPKSSQRHHKLVNAVGEFICFGLQPISVTDDSSFRKLMATADPKFSLPSRKIFSQQVIPSKYDTMKCKIENELLKSKYCALMTDLWTSQHQHRILN